ncbi:MAG: branched-chain amino acid ABC transporter permease, partial [Deltaproteobacteria bacterium]|nr:branched-chain amino acid ABC transporter permease [Deltaproteobacteria bacterium]
TLMEYDRGAMLGIKGFSAAIVGGVGNSFGAVVAGLAIGIVESFAAGFISSGYKDAFAFLIMLLVLFVRPGGILGKYEVE